MTIKCINGPLPYQTNTFLIFDEEIAAVIDPAAEAQSYLTELTANNATLKYIFLTHGHHDHIKAVEELREKTGAALYMHTADRGISGLVEDYCYEKDVPVQLKNVSIAPFFTPGHTEGSVCLIIEDICFSGDTVFCGNVGRTDLEGGSEKKLRVSVQRLMKALPDETRICPGHGEFTNALNEKRNNMYVSRLL